VSDPAVTRLAAVDPGTRTLLDRLLADVAAVEGHPALGEAARRELDAPPSYPTADFVAPGERGGLDGFAHLSHPHANWQLEVVVRPAGPDEAATVRALLGAALTAAAALGGGPLHFWTRSADGVADDVAASLGLVLGRRLLRMRAALPLAAGGPTGPAGPAIRPFRPGTDEDAWLVLNNRAFAAHPEQGDWDLGTLEALERAPWFDPDGFLVIDADPGEPAGGLVAACWTKLHRGTSPVEGEIYVIAVDPGQHRRGLGRILTVAGLDWLHRHGAELGVLYVDAANAAAVALYRSLGFTVERTERALVCEVPPGAVVQAVPTARPIP
jgi:mycothiol synthase